jgi:UDPglucose--hexose-1-phosphate uridylyltransferase
MVQKKKLKIKKTSAVKFPSELRLDLASKDWVIIATGRAKRPELFKKEGKKIEITPKKNCPFCNNIENQEKPILIYSHGKEVFVDGGGNIPKDWTAIVLPNKFPALLPQPEMEKKIDGNLYQTMNAVGFCELVVTGDHEKSLALLPIENVREVINCYQERYLKLMKTPFVNYVSIFHNHGHEAGASLSHPHSQIITTPLIDIDLQKSLSNADNYFKRKNKCVYCEMNEWEMKDRKRIVFEDEHFLTVCPFASKSAFELIISPKRHCSNFEEITETEKFRLAETLQMALYKLYKGLNNPAYNFYLHTAPCDGKEYRFYHWHWTIIPKTSTWAGFELGARMEISTIEPETAAEYLRKQ